MPIAPLPSDHRRLPRTSRPARRPGPATSGAVAVAVAAALAMLLAAGCGEAGDDAGPGTTDGTPSSSAASPAAGARADAEAQAESEAEAVRAATAATEAEIERTTAAFRDGILAAPIGLARVADLGLSSDLVARASDRRLREAHHARFHAVFADRPADPTETDEAPPPPPERAVSFAIEPHFVADAVMTRRENARTARPANRGFRPASRVGRPDDESAGRPADGTGPQSSPDLSASGAWLPAAELVARRLAFDGVAATTVRALAIGAADLPQDPSSRPAAAVDALWGIGVPVDLLEFVVPLPGGPAVPPGAEGWVATALDRLAGVAGDGGAVEALAAEAASLAIAIEPTIPGFRAAADDGVDPIAALRVQPTRGRFWAGRGGGGSLDLAVSLLEALPEVAFTLSIGSPFVPDAMLRMGPSRQGARGPVTVVDEPHVVSQWAQDNGQPGFIDGEEAPWLLAPRYATRGDLGSTLVPGDTWMVEGLPAAGIGVARSPLLFQGGNLLVVGDPAGGERLLLVGDAEIERNVGLGLDRPTIIDGFRREFGVDRVIVVRPPAFHLDFATTIRRLPAAGDRPARSVAFVHDEQRAHEMVLRIGIERLAAAGILDRPSAERLVEALDAGDGPAVVEGLGPALYARQRPDGQWPLTLTDAFGAGPGGEGIAVFDRFLCSFERLMGLSVELRRVPGPPEVRAYLASWRRRDAALGAFEEQLEQLGFELVRLPGFALQTRSVNTVNMTHGRDVILRPISGGTLSPIDEAAGEIVRAVVGRGVRVVDLPTADTQRRSGAVACAVAAWPRSPRAEAGPTLP